MRNSNLDRFIPPHPSEEPRALCVNCGATGYEADMLFDERAEHYVCDRECFDEWADANFEQVGDYYFEMNIEY